jgi:hypothetical protein
MGMKFLICGNEVFNLWEHDSSLVNDLKKLGIAGFRKLKDAKRYLYLGNSAMHC